MAKNATARHRIEIYQKSDSRRENLSRFDAILTPSWQVPPALVTFKWHLPVTKADVLLTFCTKIRKSQLSKLPGELARMAYWWRRWDARGDMREDIDFKGADIESDSGWPLFCLQGLQELNQRHWPMLGRYLADTGPIALQRLASCYHSHFTVLSSDIRSISYIRSG